MVRDYDTRRERLTPADVVRYVSEKPEKTRLHHDGGGLYLVVDKRGRHQQAGDSASWVYRYTLDGQQRTMGLGSYRDVPLRVARRLAAEARLKKAAGEDPLAERKAAKAARQRATVTAQTTFRVVAEQLIASKGAGWRKKGKTAEQWRASFRDWVDPLIGDLPIAAIDLAAVLRVLEQPVHDMGGKRFWEARSETASRCRSRIQSVLDYATAMKLRTGDNPAAWATLKFILPKRADVQTVKNHGALPYSEVPAFVATLRDKAAVSAKALEFTILTAARTTEVRGMRWDELDLEAGLWTIPAERMKAKREHRVPLTARAVEILRSLDGNGSDYVFPGAGGNRVISENTMLKLLKGLSAGVTVHGFRSSFSTWAREQTHFQKEVVEASLAHSVGTEVERAYARTTFIEKRRDLMDAWACYCADEMPDNVQLIRPASAA